MRATTIKLEKQLLEELYRLMPENKSLSAFVKEILNREIIRSKLAESAIKYREFLSENKDEAEVELLWESADLTSNPTVESSSSRFPKNK